MSLQTMAADVPLRPFVEDRFDRLRRIDWWDQDKLSAAKILVVGAGALGNEVLKNLALLGVGHVFVADLDSIEASNLTRSILFRESDVGRSKAQAAAAAARDIFPGIHIGHFHGDAMFGLGLGAYRWADLVIAGLDNREARLHVNRCCQKLGKVWIDAATETLRGVVRVFAPGGPCYECTLTALDFQILKERAGCAGLRVEGAGDRVPTTPITASIIGALQVQEALKWLHGLPGLTGKGLVFDGMSNDFYTVAYQRAEDCGGHETFADVVQLDASARTMTPRLLLEAAVARLGPGAQIDLTHELLLSLDCPHCGRTQPVFRPLSSVPEKEALCPDCGTERRPAALQSILGGESFQDRPFAELGLPPFDIVAVRRDFETIGFEFSADAPAVLGDLWPARAQHEFLESFPEEDKP